jgi:hypothetical protein
MRTRSRARGVRARLVALGVVGAAGCSGPSCELALFRDDCHSDDDCPALAVCSPSLFGRSCLDGAQCSVDSQCGCGATCQLREEPVEVGITRKTCEPDPGGAPCAVGSTGPSTCLAEAEACTLDTDCCGDTCRGFVCQPPLTCDVGGTPCRAAEECCSGECESGTCTAAKCPLGLGPQSVAEDQHDVARLVADDTSLYWIADGQVRRADKLGGQSTGLAEGARPSCLARAGARLFWASDDGIWSLAEGEAEPVAWSSSPGACLHMAASSAGIFWIAVGAEETGIVLATSGRAPAEGEALVEGLPVGEATRIAADDARVFYTVGPALLAVPVGGGEATTLFEGETRSTLGHALAQDETRVWFLAAPQLRWAAKDGSGSVEIGDSQRLQGIAVDATQIYWIDDRLYRMGKTGGERTLLSGAPARGEITGSDVVVDESCVYWIEEDRVRKTAR